MDQSHNSEALIIGCKSLKMHSYFLLTDYDIMANLIMGINTCWKIPRLKPKSDKGYLRIILWTVMHNHNSKYPYINSALNLTNIRHSLKKQK